MPNKTIYVKDEELWNKAKATAGKEGLSGVIADALAEFVEKSEAAAQGFVEHRFTVVHDADGQQYLARIAFAGRQLDSRRFEPHNAPAAIIATVYVTRGGKFLLTLGLEDDETLFHYDTYSHPDGIAEDHNLLEVADEEDLHEWAASIYLRHFQQTATETWIE